MPAAAPPLYGSTGSTTFVLAGILVIVGVAMICTAVWLVRATRTDVPALGPLEVMGDRRFHRQDSTARATALAAARPAGAAPPSPMLGDDVEPDAVDPAAAEPAAAAQPDGAVAEPVAIPDATEASDTGETPVVEPGTPAPTERAAGRDAAADAAHAGDGADADATVAAPQPPAEPGGAAESGDGGKSGDADVPQPAESA